MSFHRPCLEKIKGISMLSNKLIFPILSLAGFLACTLPAGAQDWPSQPVRIVVPYPAGGGADLIARKLAEKLAEGWKQPVTIDNKPGAGEIAATTEVMRAKSDGYTLLFATETQQMNPYLYAKLPYDPMTDITPITRLTEGIHVFVVRKESPFHTMQQMVAAAKAQPDKISFGSGGLGGTAHLAMQSFASAAGNVQFLHVPYKGSAPRMVDLLAGTIDFTATSLGGILPLLKDGRLRPIATNGASRMRALPDVPTLEELGIKGANVPFTFNLYGPAKMSPALTNQIARDVSTVLKDPDFVAKNLDPQGLVGIVNDTPAAFARFLASDRVNVAARLKAANVEPN